MLVCITARKYCKTENWFPFHFPPHHLLREPCPKEMLRKNSSRVCSSNQDRWFTSVPSAAASSLTELTTAGTQPHGKVKIMGNLSLKNITISSPLWVGSCACLLHSECVYVELDNKEFPLRISKHEILKTLQSNWVIKSMSHSVSEAK